MNRLSSVQYQGSIFHPDYIKFKCETGDDYSISLRKGVLEFSSIGPILLFTLRPKDDSSIVSECKICVNLAFRSFPLDGLENRIRFLGDDGCVYSIGQKECSFLLPSIHNSFQPSVMYLLNKEDPTTPSFLISPTEYISSNSLKYELDTITGGGFIMHPTLGNIVVFNILPTSI